MNGIRLEALAILISACCLIGSRADASTGDLAVGIDAPATMIAGNAETITLSITNRGPGPMADVSLRDKLSSGFSVTSQTQVSGPAFALSSGVDGLTNSIASFPAGGTATFQVIAVADAALFDGALLTNAISASSSSGDTNPSNNTAVAITSVRGLVSLTLANSDGQSMVVAGSIVAYSIGVYNSGPSPARNVTVTDTLLSGLRLVDPLTAPDYAITNGSQVRIIHSITNLEVGAAAGFVIRLQIDPAMPPTYPSGSAVVNEVSVSSSAFNISFPQVVDDSDGVWTESDIAVGVSNSPVAVAGNAVLYTVTASNNGPSDAHDLLLVNILPKGISLVSETQVSGPVFVQTLGGNAFYDSISTLPGGTSAVFQVWGNIDPAIADGSVLSDSAAIFTSSDDPSMENNTADSAVRVVNFPARRLVLTRGQTVHLKYRDAPATAYTFQAADTLQGPFTDLAPPMVSDPAGVVEYDDQDVHEATRFYRVSGPVR